MDLDVIRRFFCIASLIGGATRVFLTKPSGPIFGAKEEVAPTSPPTALRHTKTTKTQFLFNIFLEHAFKQCTTTCCLHTIRGHFLGHAELNADCSKLRPPNYMVGTI